jgi:hypothetical protein
MNISSQAKREPIFPAESGYSYYFLDPADLAALKPDLDAMGMGGRFCQDILEDTLGEFAGTLILL